MNDYQINLQKVNDILGGYDAIGSVCNGITGKAVMKWFKNGRPPRTEYSGETNYAVLIEAAVNGEVKASSLIPKLPLKAKAA